MNLLDLPTTILDKVIQLVPQDERHHAAAACKQMFTAVISTCVKPSLTLCCPISNVAVTHSLLQLATTQQDTSHLKVTLSSTNKSQPCCCSQTISLLLQGDSKESQTIRGVIKVTVKDMHVNYSVIQQISQLFPQCRCIKLRYCCPASQLTDICNFCSQQSQASNSTTAVAASHYTMKSKHTSTTICNTWNKPPVSELQNLDIAYGQATWSSVSKVLGLNKLSSLTHLTLGPFNNVPCPPDALDILPPHIMSVRLQLGACHAGTPRELLLQQHCEQLRQHTQLRSIEITYVGNASPTSLPLVPLLQELSLPALNLTQQQVAAVYSCSALTSLTVAGLESWPSTRTATPCARVATQLTATETSSTCQLKALRITKTITCSQIPSLPLGHLTSPVRLARVQFDGNPEGNYGGGHSSGNSSNVAIDAVSVYSNVESAVDHLQTCVGFSSPHGLSLVLSGDSASVDTRGATADMWLRSLLGQLYQLDIMLELVGLPLTQQVVETLSIADSAAVGSKECMLYLRTCAFSEEFFECMRDRLQAGALPWVAELELEQPVGSYSVGPADIAEFCTGWCKSKRNLVLTCTMMGARYEVPVEEFVIAIQRLIDDGDTGIQKIETQERVMRVWLGPGLA